MSEIAQRYATVAEGFTMRVDGAASADAWDAPSPCPGWTARDVARHVVETHRRVLAGLDGGDAMPLGSDDDVVSAWAEASFAMTAALGDPIRSAQVIGGIFGEQPFEQLVGRLVCTDTLVHTWDLARATGQDERLDPDAVTIAYEWLQPLDDALRAPGGFGPKCEPPAGADLQTRFLCFAGRTP